MFDPFRFLPVKLQIAWLRRKLRLEEAWLEAETKALRRERYETLMGQIGIMTTSWAFLEMSIDTVIDLVHARGGNQAIQRDLPTSLKAKLAYLRAIPRKVSRLSHLSDDLQSFVDQMQSLKDLRHDITHGMTKILDKALDIEVTRFRYGGTKLSITKRIVGQRQLSESTGAMVSLNREIALIAVAIAQALGESEYENAFRDLEVSATFAVKVSDHLNADAELR